MHHALQLEEIRTAIARFLNMSSVIACARCCQEWHTSFSRQIWYSLVLRTTVALLPPLEALEANKQYIHRLTISGCNIFRYLHLKGCSNLTHLNLIGPMYRQEDMDGWNGWTFLVNHHQTSLQHLTVDTWIMMAKHFCIAVAGCSQLKTLKLTGRLIDPLIAPALWSACRAAKMINTLHLEHTALPKWNQEFEEGTATHIRRLIIVEPQKSCDGLDLLQHCPQLQYLHWRDSESVLFPLRKVAESLLRGQWPHLEELDLTLYDSEDQDLAMMIEGITRLVTLHMEFSAFGPKSLQAMSKHFSTIRTLNVAVCMYVSSSMIQTILSSMPALESLKTDRIHYLDIVNGTPWVSLHLQQLIINVDMGTRQKDSDNNFAAHQRIVFERLSTLVRLRVLDLTRTSPTKSARVLDLRLSAGLGALSTLRELESFSFKSHTQQMSMDDIRWIITSWPQLRKISGRFAADPDHYYEIKHLLNSHKILVFD